MRLRLFVGSLLSSAIALALASTNEAKAAPPPKNDEINQCIEAFEDAQVKQRKGELTAAIDAYKSCARPQCPSAVRTDCTLGLDIAEKAVPTVTLVLRDKYDKDRDGTIKVDGRLLEIQRGRAVPLDPGDHVIRFTIDGTEGRVLLTAHEGEKSRLVILKITAETIAAPEKKEPRGAPMQLEPPTAATSSRSPTSEDGLPYWGGPVALGVVGVAAITASLVLYFDYSAEEERLRKQFEEANVSCPDCSPLEKETRAINANRLKLEYEANEEEGRARRPWMIASMIGGGLALTAGTVLFFLLRPSSSSSSSSARITPLVGLDRSGLRVEF